MAHPTGQKLRQARENRKISIEQAAYALRIRARYLHALEDGDFDLLPSQAQARGFLRAYAHYLKLDAEPLLTALSSETSGTAAPEPAPTNEPVISTASADTIFLELGNQLRKQREQLGLSLEDVERHTHLRLHYLTAIETGKIEDLPSPVQGRGMISNYASFLGLDPQVILLHFADGLQAQLAARRASLQVDRPSKPKRPSRISNWVRSFFTVDLLIAGSLVVFLTVFVIWYTLRISSGQTDEEPLPTAPSIAEVLAQPTITPSPTPELTASAQPNEMQPAEHALETALPTDQINAGPDQPVPTSTFFPLEQAEVRVYIVVRQRTWMRVIIDGEKELEGRVVPGSVYLFEGEERIEVLTGNGAALQVFYNDLDQGSLGILGEVVNRIYTTTGVQTPTPTITPTGLPAPTPTPTRTSPPEAPNP